MRVHEAGHHHVPACVDHMVRLARQLGGGPDGLDRAATHEHAGARDLAPGVVHRRDEVCVADQQGVCGHDGSIIGSPKCAWLHTSNISPVPGCAKASTLACSSSRGAAACTAAGA